MSNPISVLPPEGVFVTVTDNGVAVRATFWNGQWRELLADGGWLAFSEAATWVEEVVVPAVPVQPAPVVEPVVEPAPAPKAEAPAAEPAPAV